MLRAVLHYMLCFQRLCCNAACSTALHVVFRDCVEVLRAVLHYMLCFQRLCCNAACSTALHVVLSETVL